MKYLLVLLTVLNIGCASFPSLGQSYDIPSNPTEYLKAPASVTSNEQIDKDESGCKMKAYGLRGQNYNDFFTLCMQNLGYKLTPIEVK